uniref:Ig-like domain-containing protein n=1 Tax=Sus scrofa TaxID=9823 RepID=A0A4X1SL85_PIG
ALWPGKPLCHHCCCCCSWALSKAHHLQSVAGQTLSLRCQYPPKNGPYERKGWCKEVSELLCTGLVTSSRPHMLAQASRFSIWDSPSSGFFVVTMTGLREEDTGHYWCRIYPTSGHSVSKSVRFHLAVSPGTPSSRPPWPLPPTLHLGGNCSSPGPWVGVQSSLKTQSVPNSCHSLGAPIPSFPPGPPPSPRALVLSPPQPILLQRGPPPSPHLGLWPQAGQGSSWEAE